MLNLAASKLGEESLEFFRVTLADAWDKLSDLEKNDIRDLFLLMAETRLLELAGQDVGDAVAILESALLQWKVAGKTIIIGAFKQTAREVFGLGGEFLGGLLRALIKKV